MFGFGVARNTCMQNINVSLGFCENMQSSKECLVWSINSFVQYFISIQLPNE